jgi:elongation factor P
MLTVKEAYMSTSNAVAPGMTISVGKELYRVESCVKVTVSKGKPFIKTKLQNLISGKIMEKNFKLNQKIEIVSLEERNLEFLYAEGKQYLFFDIDTLDKVLVDAEIVGDKIEFLKEGVDVKASYCGEKVFSVELPQFLEVMVVGGKDEVVDGTVSEAQKEIVLETGAKVLVPLFIEVGDIIKVDTKTNEYIQRI